MSNQCNSSSQQHGTKRSTHKVFRVALIKLPAPEKSLFASSLAYRSAVHPAFKNAAEAVTLNTQTVQVKMASVGLLPGGVKPANVLLPGDVKSRGDVTCYKFTLSHQCCLDRKQLRCEAAAIPLASSPRIKANTPSEKHMLTAVLLRSRRICSIVREHRRLFSAARSRACIMQTDFNLRLSTLRRPGHCYQPRRFP